MANRADVAEPRYKYEPDSPLAIRSGPKQGYVAYPNVNPAIEMVGWMGRLSPSRQLICTTLEVTQVEASIA